MTPYGISKRLRLVIWCGMLWASPSVVSAQKPYAVPASPAFTFLEATPGTVARPTTARALAGSVLDGISATGQVQQGIALDLAPWSLFPSIRIPLEEYQSSPASYILANTQVSFASVRAAADSADTDLGFGVRVTLFDRSDPMGHRGYTDTLRRMLAACLPDQPTEGAEAKADACAHDVSEAWRKKWLDRSGNWNGAGLSFAVAGGWTLENSLVTDTEWRGAAGWISGAVPILTSGQILGQVRYDLAEEDAREGLSYGGRLFWGSATMNLFLELAGDRRGDVNHEPEWTAGFEFRASNDLWLSAGFGSRDEGDAGQRGVLIADLRWNIADAPRLTRN